ncbi:MAG: hypothetical protein QXS19_07040 [Candidatus Methanomethylicia archaeon]
MSQYVIEKEQAEKIVDLIYNAIRFYTKDFKDYKRQNGILTLYSSDSPSVNLVGEYKSDTVNFIYEFPFSIMRRGSLTINMSDIVSDRKAFFKKQIKSIHLNIKDNSFSLKITNSALNTLSFDFDFVDDLSPDWHEEIKKDYDLRGNLIYRQTASAFSKFVLDNYVERMVRLQLNLLTLHSFDNGPVVVVKKFSKEDMIKSLEYLKDLHVKQKQYAEYLKSQGEQLSVDYVKAIERDIKVIENALKEDRDEYYVVTNITIMRRPQAEDPELTEVLNELLDRIYITMNIEDDHIVIYPNELFYITGFYLLDKFEESYINIYHDSITNRRMVSIEFFDGSRIISKMPSPELLFDVKNMVLVAGIRPEPDITGLTEERLQHIKRVLFEKDYNVAEQHYSNLIYDSTVLFNALKGAVDPEMLQDVMDKLKAIKEQMNNRQNFYEIFSNLFKKELVAR